MQNASKSTRHSRLSQGFGAAGTRKGVTDRGGLKLGDLIKQRHEAVKRVESIDRELEGALKSVQGGIFGRMSGYGDVKSARKPLPAKRKRPLSAEQVRETVLKLLKKGGGTQPRSLVVGSLKDDYGVASPENALYALRRKGLIERKGGVIALVPEQQQAHANN